MRTLFTILAIAGFSLPVTAQGDVVEECRPVVENGVDVTVRYRPTTPNPLGKGHGLVVMAIDRSAGCITRITPGGTTVLLGLPPGEYTYHLLWNGEGKRALTVPDTSFALSIEVPSENRLTDCREDDACAEALRAAPPYAEATPEAFFMHLGAVLGGARGSEATLCLREPGDALDAVRVRYPDTSVEPRCDRGGHFIIVRDVVRSGGSITARISSGLHRPGRGNYWPTGYLCLIEDNGSEFRAVQCVIESMA